MPYLLLLLFTTFFFPHPASAWFIGDFILPQSSDNLVVSDQSANMIEDEDLSTVEEVAVVDMDVESDTAETLISGDGSAEVFVERANGASVVDTKVQAKQEEILVDVEKVDAVEKVAAEKAVAEKAVAEKAVAEKAVAEKAVAEKAAAEKAAAEKAAAEKAAAEKAAAEKVAAEKVAAEKVAVEKAAAEKATADFVFVKGGCFSMGSNGCGLFSECSSNEEPAHEVCLDDFWMGKYEVTQSQWQKVMGENPSQFIGRDRPVEQVNWDDIQDFLLKLNTLSGSRYRLPTEAEWEYAARSGGKNSKWADTNSEKLLGDYAWYNSNSDGQSHPVGQKLPNGLGLYDMSGNVWEWCSDNYDSKYYVTSPNNNPQGPSGGIYRIARGGSWLDNPQTLRSAFRYHSRPEYRIYFIGFRLVIPVR